MTFMIKLSYVPGVCSWVYRRGAARQIVKTPSLIVFFIYFNFAFKWELAIHKWFHLQWLHLWRTPFSLSPFSFCKYLGCSSRQKLSKWCYIFVFKWRKQWANANNWFFASVIFLLGLRFELLPVFHSIYGRSKLWIIFNCFCQ